MSDKPRVYQGVRVKTTVKELLQRHRAREANRKKVKTISQACLELQELCASTFPSRPVDPPSTISPTHTRAFPVPDSSCSIQMQEIMFNDIQPQFGDVMLPGNGYSNNNNPCASTSYNTSLPLHPTSPLPWCHGLSSDADFYGNGMAPCSSSASPTLCNSMDHNSYSPQDSFSSSSSSCYDSPTRIEPSYRGLASEYFHYQHCNPQDCYCLPHCWPSQQESFTAPENASYNNPTDYPYACPVEEDYFRRDYPVSSEMCYNVL